MTKKDELQVTIEMNKVDLVIVSESNMDMTDVNLIEERKAAFRTFSFSDKKIDPFPKARMTIMIHQDVPFQQAGKYEDDTNPMASIRIKEGRNKSLIITGFYRQWKAPGESDSNTQWAGKRTLAIFKKFSKLIFFFFIG